MNPDPEQPAPPAEVQPAEPAQPPPERVPFWGYEDAVALLLLGVFMMFLVAAFFLLLPWRPRAKAAGAIAAQFTFYALWFGALWALIRLRYGRPFWRSLAWVRPPGGLFRSVLWGLGVALASILLLIVLRPPEIKTPLEELIQDPVSLMLVGIFAVTLGPLCEELAFRGFLLPLFMRTMGAAGGIVATAALFALPHGFEYAWSWQRLIAILFAGAMFGWVRYRTGSTAAATMMHASYNMVFFAGLLAERYGVVR